MSRSPSLGAAATFSHSLLLLSLMASAAAGAASVHHPSRHIEQIPLTLVPPALPPAALAGQRLDLQLRPSYSGDLALAFALDTGPDGMTIDAETGVLSWTPPSSAEGEHVTVSASVTDSVWTAHASFSLAVAKTKALASSLTGSTLTVTAAGALHGMSLAFPAGATPPPAQVTLATVQGVSLPSLPDGVRRLTDPFTATPVDTPRDGWITVSLPASVVPAGAAPQDLCLYVSGGGDEDGGARWIPEWLDLDVLPNGTTTLKVASLGGLCVVGLAPPLSAGSGSPGSTAAASAPEITEMGQPPACGPRMLSNGTYDQRRWICGATGAFPFTVDVVYERTPLWLPSGLNVGLGAGMLAQYLADAASKLDTRGMQWPSRVAVSVEEMGAAATHGDSSLADHYGVLRVDSGLVSFDQLKCAVAHSAFLRSAALVPCTIGDNVLWATSHDSTYLHKTDWIVKGLARWFEDDVYTAVNSYRWDVQSPYQSYPPVLAAGLGAYPNASRPLTDSNKRALFWKLVAGRCHARFSPKDVICASLEDDPAGLAPLKKALSEKWTCDTTTAFGDEPGFEMADMLLQYSVFTEGANNITLIDPGAPDMQFETPVRVLTPSVATAPGQYPQAARATLRLPPASVAAVRIAAVDPLPAGASVTLTLTPSGDTVGAWACPTHASQAGTMLFASTQPKSTTYGDSGNAPEQFVAVVNPSLADSTTVDLLASIANPNSGSLSFSFEDPAIFWCHWSWLGRVDVTVAGPAGLTAMLHADPSRSDMVDLDIAGAVAAFPITIDVTGDLTVTAPASNGTRCDDLSCCAYQTMTYSNPTMRVNTTEIGAPAPFHLRRTFYQPYPGTGCQDVVSIAWNYLDEKYTAEGDIWLTSNGTGDRGALCVKYSIAKH